MRQSQDYNLYTWNFGSGVGTYVLNSKIDPIGYPQNGAGGSLTVTAVPELSTWAMMLMGIVGLGFAAYRRTKKAIPALAAA